MSSKSPAACSLFRGAALVAAFFFPSITCLAQDVLTYHNNNARTGVNNKETILTPANVSAATFRNCRALFPAGLVDAGLLQRHTLLRPGWLSAAGLPVPECQAAHLSCGENCDFVRLSGGNAEHLLKRRKDTIVWAMENSNPGVLHAYEARTLLELYYSDQASSGRDHFGAGDKFMTPMIANGKVYVATPTGVGVFGLLK